MVRKLVMILFLSLTNSVNNPKLNSNIYVRLEIVLFFTPFWEWIQILFGSDYWLITDYMNVKWDGTITLRVTQWVHFVLGVWIVTGTQACR